MGPAPNAPFSFTLCPILGDVLATTRSCKHQTAPPEYLTLTLCEKTTMRFLGALDGQLRRTWLDK